MLALLAFSAQIPFLWAKGAAAVVVVADRSAKKPFVVDAGSVRLRLEPVGGASAAVELRAAEKSAQPAFVPDAHFAFAQVSNFDATYVVPFTFAFPAEFRSGMYRAEFAEGRVRRPTEPSLLYISSSSLASDTGLEAARGAFAGKTLYLQSGQAGGRLSCMPLPARALSVTEQIQTHYAFERGSPWRVLGVSRALGATEEGYFSNSDPDFIALDPLRFELAYAGRQQPGATPLCKTYLLTAADAWEARRWLLPRSPFAHPEWPAKMRTAIREEDVLTGMTHEMVAASIGYPSVYGSIEQLDALSQWYYDRPTPFQATVYFKGDRVVKYDPPGNLP